MHKSYLLIGLLGLILTGCEGGSNPDITDAGPDTQDQSTTTTTTPTAQTEKMNDLRITKEIRHLLINDDYLSANAKNVRIITVNGIVTLKGLVNNKDEKLRVAYAVSRIQGVKKIDNQVNVIRQNYNNQY